MSFNENLKRIRKEKCVGTVKNFAENILKIPYKTYHIYETKDTLPPEDIILKIAKTLNVSVDELFGIKPSQTETLKDAESTVKELNNIGFTASYDKNNDTISCGEKVVNITIPGDEFTKILTNCKETARKEYEPLIAKTTYTKIMCHLMDIQTQEMLTPKEK